MKLPVKRRSPLDDPISKNLALNAGNTANPQENSTFPEEKLRRNAHSPSKKLKKNEDLKEVSVNIKANACKVLDFKAKKPQKTTQKTITAFLNGKKSGEKLEKTEIYREIPTKEPIKPQNSTKNAANASSLFNNTEKFRLSALQKAIFYKELEELYSKTIEKIPIFREFSAFLQREMENSTTNRDFLQKMLKFCVLRFIFENPGDSWHKVYKPLCSKDLLNAKNTGFIKGWLEGFLRKQREFRVFPGKSHDSNEVSVDFASEFFEDRENSRSLATKAPFLREIHEICFENQWKFNSLLVRGKPGIGKSTAVFSAAIDLEYEVIEINNSSKRSEKALKKIYEATQSQGIVSSQFKDFLVKSSIECEENAGNNAKNLKKVIYVRDYDKNLDVDIGFKKTIHEFVKSSKHPIILSTSNENFEDFNANDFDTLNFSDYSLEEISILLKMILEIEGNLRPFHEKSFFDEFFIEKGLQNHSKSIASLSNDAIFTGFLQKFASFPQNLENSGFQTYYSLENIKEIVCFYNGNLSVLFTKFEFLNKFIKTQGFQKLKPWFFLENPCFDLTKREKYNRKTFPKELKQKKTREILGFSSKTQIFVGETLFQEIKNLTNIIDTNTNEIGDCLETYARFLENTQNLDVLNRKYCEKAGKTAAKHQEIVDFKGNYEQDCKPKSDITGYLKPICAKSHCESNNYFDERVFKEHEISRFRQFLCRNHELCKENPGFQGKTVKIHDVEPEILMFLRFFYYFIQSLSYFSDKINNFKDFLVKRVAGTQLCRESLMDFNNFLLNACFMENLDIFGLRTRLRNKKSVEKITNPFSNKLIATLLTTEEIDQFMKCSESPWFLEFYKKKHQDPVDCFDEDGENCL